MELELERGSVTIQENLDLENTAPWMEAMALRLILVIEEIVMVIISWNNRTYIILEILLK